MRNLSTCLCAAALLALAVGCSSGPSTGGLFDSGCNTCAAPAPQPVCAPPVADCAPPVVADQGQRPPEARPGEVWCYVRVPAVTRMEEDRVCVRQESARQIPIPAVTEQRAVQVCVRPAETRTIPIAAEFQDQCEQVCVAPGRTEWQKVDCNPSSLAPKEQVGECWTLVDVPAQYQTRTKRICVREASCRTEQIPAEFETRYETVVRTPACSRTEVIPAQFETRLREVVVCGPRWEWRRTTECEVPTEAPVAGFEDNYLPGAAPAPIEQPPYGADPVGNPDADLPPAGALPPLR
ncbi:MAG: hypothetical protein O2894_08415 [Planctomycetota bacterium]|nr:hypothetical protein [Planctomycetota bacterium]